MLRICFVHRLDADYAVECGTTRWNKYAPWVGVAGIAYALGVPWIFVFLTNKFHEQGKCGDKVVQRRRLVEVLVIGVKFGC